VNSFVRAAAVTAVALAAPPTAQAATHAFVAVNRIQALPAHAVAGRTYRLHGSVSNAGARAARGRVTVRLLHRGRTPRVLGRAVLRVGAHATRRFSVAVRVPAVTKGSWILAACAPRGIGGTSTCATGASNLEVAGGDPIRGPVAAKQAAPAVAQAPACSSGSHSIAPFGDVAYPEGGNGGYKSVHTDTHLIYDAPSNQFLPGTHVDQTILATQCLTDFSFDFETKDPPNSNADADTPGPDMTVGSVEVNGQPAQFAFVQPTYPGDPKGDADPDPLAHRTGQANPINADNPNPPACASTSPDPEFQNLPCPANKLVVTPSAPVPAGTSVKVEIDYTGRPGVHSDGDGTTEGWFRSSKPVNDGGFVTTEPMGTEDWMPLNDHPTAKPTYDFTTITNIDRTAISNGQLVSHTTNAADPQFPGAPASGNVPAQPAGSATWVWHMPNPVQDYLVENSVGYYSNGYDDGVHGGVKIGAAGTLYYEFQSAGVDPSRVASNKATMDRQEDITSFQSLFNGPFPFTTDGVVIGTPSASFEEEMETKITFANGSIGFGTFNHENMHQWWGDNVAASLTRYTFLKEGMATLGEYLNTARTAATNAGGYGTPAGNAAFDASMVSQFNTTYASGTTNRTRTFWTEVPSNPTPNSLFDNAPTYARPGASYAALRQILGDDRFITALQGIQHDFGGGNISEAQMEAQYHKYIPNHSAACSAKLDAFFTQWWDTAYAPGGGANRPQITGPGLAGPGFYDASGPCSKQNPPVTTASIANGALVLSATDDGAGPGATVYSLDGGPSQTYTGPVALTPAAHTVVFHSTDAQGNQEADQTATFVTGVSVPATVGGSVPATLALTLGAPAAFGAFTPGVAKDYSATTTATVVSSAADAALSVSDPDTVAPGHLVNGAFSLPSPLTTSAGAVSGTPLTVKTWSAPVSNDQVPVTFGQHIGSGDALRTGTYAKTLTFTLSTTTP
jgi:hypothetical protein